MTSVALYALGALAVIGFGFAVLVLILSLAGLIWVPLGAMIAGRVSHVRKRFPKSAKESAAHSSMHMLFPWIYIMVRIYGSPRRPPVEQFLHAITLLLWLLGPVLVLFAAALFLVLVPVIDPTGVIPTAPAGPFDYIVEYAGALILIVAGIFCSRSWRRSFHVFRERAKVRDYCDDDLRLSAHLAQDIRRAIGWSVIAIVLYAVLTTITLVVGKGGMM